MYQGVSLLVLFSYIFKYPFQQQIKRMKKKKCWSLPSEKRFGGFLSPSPTTTTTTYTHIFCQGRAYGNRCSYILFFFFSPSSFFSFSFLSIFFPSPLMLNVEVCFCFLFLFGYFSFTSHQ
ncbi:hypothetical protein, unlikely [Trypanosoma brucei gambiense DAL972]|uniref:Uncharacterized protein n=1 Tax=Trypanosoma brucei gambiense (strain MHOM/CI/86/DAL972) TaxID=679716 RepID=C9ZQH2_TRYB9|nr:hypothetical protein, unlikely [Trypanosoma brucei gambiense DAL972]CBH11652.1 hypothetical protein, unlikely [Trypanosoma brucei gambiense DAL972]|eukprot:XP_011773937.1 hypothetical protein, unlikely [Trypanosoma brucei gambiense DAL972]